VHVYLYLRIRGKIYHGRDALQPGRHVKVSTRKVLLDKVPLLTVPELEVPSVLRLQNSYVQDSHSYKFIPVRFKIPTGSKFLQQNLLRIQNF
jgi:hypothetical protein